MSVVKCIRGKVEAGTLTKEQGAEVEDTIRRYEEKNRRGLNEEQADALSAKQALESLSKDKARKARQTKMALVRQANLLKNKAAYGGDGYRWLLSELDADPWARNPSPPVKHLQEMHRNNAFAMMNDVLAHFRPRLAGIRRPRAGIEDMIRELHGQDTGIQSAKELAQGFRDAAKYVWTEFNRFSGDTIPWRDDWAMPHHYDAVKVGSVAPEQFVDDIMGELKREAMLDFDTGQPLSDAELRPMLRDIYEGIRTHGMSDMTPGANGGRSLANRRSDARILQFKDGDSWLRISDKYGAGDPLHSMYHYVESMARDIGLMQKFGPNPSASVNTIKDMLAIEEARKPVAASMMDYARKQAVQTRARAVDNTFAQLTGSAAIPTNGFFSGLLNATRSVLSGILLQSSTLSAITDVNGQRIAMRMVGMPEYKALTNIVRNFKGAFKGDQQLALHMSLGSDSWAQTATGVARFTGETAGPQWTRRFLDTTMRAIGLTPWTQGGKNVFGLDFYNFLARQAGKSFEDLPKDLQSEFSRFGIDRDYWNVIRKTDLYEAHNGAKYVNPLNVFNGDDALAREASTRLQNMQLTLQKIAVIEVSPRVKAGIVGETKGGTLQGEIARNIGLFKSFPLTLLHMQLFHAVQSRAGMRFGRAKMFANVVIGSAVFGALAVQMREIANGRDPMEMNPQTSVGRKFWAKAIMQGGGLSLFGDFLFADQNRFGKGFWTSLLGPMADLGDDISRFTVGNVQHLLRGEKTNVAKEGFDLVNKYLPFGKFWYWKLAFERNVLDQLDMGVDPKAHQRFADREKTYWTQQRQKYWWRPGQKTPNRAPDMSAVSGQ